MANESGSFPLNLFQAMDRSSNLLQFVKEVRNSHSFSSFASSSFPSTSNHRRCCNPANTGGKTLWNLFLETSNTSRPERLAIEGGTVPVKRLNAICICWMLGRLVPKSSGRLPCRLLLAYVSPIRDTGMAIRQISKNQDMPIRQIYKYKLIFSIFLNKHNRIFNKHIASSPDDTR